MKSSFRFREPAEYPVISPIEYMLMLEVHVNEKQIVTTPVSTKQVVSASVSTTSVPLCNSKFDWPNRKHLIMPLLIQAKE